MSAILQNDEARPEVDEVLRDYFHAEMPKPWPAFKPPRVIQPASFWSRYSGRLALAACVTLMIGGYLALANCFPQTGPGTGVQHETGNIGLKDKPNKNKKAN